jgi:SNF2 family DNA or RNA helicase
LKAGGSGLNLQGADTVYHLDPWWNLAAEEQATDRAHRIGQKRPVQVFKLVCHDSIEEKVLLLQDKKKALYRSVITEGEEGITHLSVEDLLYLLSSSARKPEVLFEDIRAERGFA